MPMPKFSITAVARCAAIAAMMCLGVDGQRLGGSAGPSFRRASATDGVPEEATSQHRREAASPWDAGSRRARAGPNFLTSSSDATKAMDAAAAVGGWEEQMTASVSDVDAKDMSVETLRSPIMENMIKAAPSDVNTLVNRKLQAIIIDDPCVDRDPAFCELKLPDIAAKSLYCKTLAIVQPCLETCGFCPPSSSTMPSPVVSSLPSSQPSVVPSVLAPVALYDSIEACCSVGMWWVDYSYCTSRSVGSYTNGWSVDFQDEKCTKDCDPASGPPCHGIENEYTSALIYDTVEACCARLDWIDTSSCVSASEARPIEALSGNTLPPDQFFADYATSSCLKDCEPGPFGCMLVPPSSQPSTQPSSLPSSQPSVVPSAPNGVECDVLGYCTTWVPSSAACDLLNDETLLCRLRCNRGITSGDVGGAEHAEYKRKCLPCAACVDDPAWARKNHPKQKCAWVAENPRKRCKKKSKTGVKAKKVCLVACNKC